MPSFLGNLYISFINSVIYSYTVYDKFDNEVYSFNNNKDLYFFTSLIKFDRDGSFIWSNYILYNETYNGFTGFPVITCNNNNLYLQLNAATNNYLGGFN